MPEPKVNQPGMVPRLASGETFAFDRKKFLDGSIPVFWGPGQPYLDPLAPARVRYSNPTDWPAKGTTLRVPRMVRFFFEGRDIDYYLPDLIILREERYEGDTIKVKRQNTNGTYQVYEAYRDTGQSTFLYGTFTGPRVAPPVSNKAEWFATADRIKAALADKPNLYFHSENDVAFSEDPLECATIPAPTDLRERGFYTDVLVIKVIASNWIFDDSMAAKIRRDYAKFAGFRLALFVDTGFFDEIVGKVPFSSSAATPITIQRAKDACAALADYGVTYGGEISYKSGSPAPFLDLAHQAWPDLAS